jgi:hypothetical protein
MELGAAASTTNSPTRFANTSKKKLRNSPPQVCPEKRLLRPPAANSAVSRSSKTPAAKSGNTDVRRAIGKAAPGLPLTGVRPLREQVSGQLEQVRTIAGLSSTFGGLALMLACLGLYGTMSYRVSRRTSEIGIRVALGAQHGNVLWMLMRECLFLLTVGLALTATRLIANQLFNLSPMDPPTVVLATVFLPWVQ